jgi:hypothetical protein
MPRNSSKPTTKPSETTNGGGSPLPTFVSCELNDAERAVVKANVLSGKDTIDKMHELIEEGYKFSFSFDDRSGAIMLVVTGSKTRENGGLAMSSRGPSCEAAFSMFVYKHFEKLHERWSEAPSRAAQSIWG